MPFEEFASGLGAWGILLVTTFAGMYLVTKSITQQATATAEQDSAFVKLALSQTERVNHLSDERMQLSSAVADLTRRVFNLEVDLGNAMRNTKEREVQIDKLTLEVDGLKIKLANEKQRSEQAEQENEKLRGRIAELETQVKDLEGRIAAMMLAREQELKREVLLIESVGE